MNILSSRLAIPHPLRRSTSLTYGLYTCPYRPLQEYLGCIAGWRQEFHALAMRWPPFEVLFTQYVVTEAVRVNCSDTIWSFNVTVKKIRYLLFSRYGKKNSLSGRDEQIDISFSFFWLSFIWTLCGHSNYFRVHFAWTIKYVYRRTYIRLHTFTVS